MVPIVTRAGPPSCGTGSASRPDAGARKVPSGADRGPGEGTKSAIGSGRATGAGARCGRPSEGSCAGPAERPGPRGWAATGPSPRADFPGPGAHRLSCAANPAGAGGAAGPRPGLAVTAGVADVGRPGCSLGPEPRAGRDARSAVAADFWPVAGRGCARSGRGGGTIVSRESEAGVAPARRAGWGRITGPTSGRPAPLTGRRCRLAGCASGLCGGRASGLCGGGASGLCGGRASGLCGGRASGLCGGRASGLSGGRASVRTGTAAAGVRRCPQGTRLRRGGPGTRARTS